MNRLVGLLLLTTLGLVGCPKKQADADAGVPVIDECDDELVVKASAIPTTLRVNGAATVTATGGTGRFTYAITTNASGGTLSGNRYIAGPTPGVDVVAAVDDCGNSSSVDLDVHAAFDVKSARATIKPATRFSIRVQGTLGAPTFTTSGSLPSGGTMSAAGEYTAGPSAATDLITVQDSKTGDQALLQFTVSPSAEFRPVSPRLALPTGAVVPLDSLDGSNVVTWKITAGVGLVRGAVYAAPGSAAQGTDAVIEGHDDFTNETVLVKVRMLTELTRPARAQGRRSDVATAVTGDFDGDGFRDLAIGSQESDLARPQGGAVFIFRGSATGLAAAATWTILPDSDTAQLGAVLAAGDLDGDGKDDLAISEPGADVTTGDSGAVLLYRITAEGPRLIRPVLSGLGAGRFGSALVIADVDYDGDNDLIVGSPAADIAPGTFNTRGVVDVFLLQKGRPISDSGNLRLGGVDLAADGTLRPFTGLRAARGLVVADPLTHWQVTGGSSALVTVAGRATTALGDFTGRIAKLVGTGELATWSVASASIPNAQASQLIGGALDIAAMGGALRAVVGSPGYSGPAIDHSGNDVDAGQVLLFAMAEPGNPRVLAEGSSTGTYVRDGGWAAFGGRGVGVDVAMTDFDGDGRADIAIAAPNFTPPNRIADGGASSPEYVVNNAACLSPAAQTPGGVFVHLALPDGTYKEAYRLWAMRDVPGGADGGLLYQRTQLGRSGVIGGFDFDGDGKQDLGIARAAGFEVLTGRAPDDLGLGKLSMGCDPVFSLPALGPNQYATAPAALGDLSGDGCAEIGFRYTDNNTRSGIIIVFGFGSMCSQTTASWVRISGDAETGVNNLRLGTSMARAGQILANDSRDFVAVTADLYSYDGISQPTVLLFDTAEIVAKRPATGGALVAALGDGLTPVPTVYFKRAPGFGRMLLGGDVTGDGKRDLLVAAPGANVNGDGTGAVFVFAAGMMKSGPNTPVMTIVSDQRERAAFGQDLAVSAQAGTVPAAIAIGAPMSYRSGTSNGTAYVLPLDY